MRGLDAGRAPMLPSRAMRHGIYNLSSFAAWANTLPTDRAPTAEEIAFADRFAPADRQPLVAWWEPEIKPMLALARSFNPKVAPMVEGTAKVEHLYAVPPADAAALLEAYGSLSRVAIEGVSTRLTEAESAACSTLPLLDELRLRGIPAVAGLAHLRPRLRSLSLYLHPESRFESLFAEPWPALEELTIGRSEQPDLITFAKLLPSFGEILPKCRSLSLVEHVTRRAPLLEALVASPWAASLEVFRLVGVELPPKKLALVADIPFTQLRHLAVDSLDIKPGVGKTLAGGSALANVESLEIARDLGATGLKPILKAWPKLKEVLVWHPMRRGEDLITDFGLRDFVARGGLALAAH